MRGLLYDPERPDDAIGAIRELLANRSQRNYLVEQGLKTAESGDCGSETRILVEHYRRAIAMHRGRGSLYRRLRSTFLV